ncbi:hypothetical protein BJ980_001335 [Nocardioides daedukensis]|jgi:hypothetical protein|uniref:Uncharacterized protein n=1 Tax=Nocardioides daedukensis TaxID=634462 RepID=A0A7Y9S0T8_9ACTN|nr:hypothetical protein [Nocardioides daedukensis]NYG58412.1 hypothetical protein [Nocardioides daedukensis]
MTPDSREPRGPEQISRNEIRKDAIQDSFEATVNAVGQVGGAVTGAVRDVARTLGGLASELFEIRDAARRAQDENRD